MAPAITYVLPAMQLMCNVVVPGTPGLDLTTTGPTVHQPLPQIQPKMLPDGYIAHRDIGTAYKIYSTKVNWKTARERCIAEGANLAVIDSSAKLEHLINQVGSTAEMYVGIHRMYDDTEWVSATTGSTLTDLPWASSDPSGDSDCVVASKNPHGLRNFGCSGARNSVCELRISEN